MEKLITWSNPRTEIMPCLVIKLNGLENTVVQYLCGNYINCLHGKVTLGKCSIIFKVVFRVIYQLQTGAEPAPCDCPAEWKTFPAPATELWTDLAKSPHV